MWTFAVPHTPRLRSNLVTVDPPPIRFTQRDGSRLAYQVFGGGPHHVVWTLELVEHFDLLWTDPHFNHNFERVAGYARVVLLQRRGFGLSDPIDYVPSLEQQADDILAVMDEVGMPAATVAAHLSNCPAAVLVAASHPSRVNGLLLANPYLQGPTTTKTMLGVTPDDLQAAFDAYRRATDNYGEGAFLPLWETALDSGFNRRLFGLLERCSANREAARAQLDFMFSVDVTDLLASVQCPTRVVHTQTGVFPAELARAIAEAVQHGSSGALPVPAPGTSLGEGMTPWVDEMQTLVTGYARPADADRKLGSILFTDVVGSTEVLARIGDAAYGALRTEHEHQVRHQVELHGGTLANVSGDGTLSLFDSPTKAVRCATAIRAGAEGLGLQLRAGVHTGEINWTAVDVSGLAVHLAARVSAIAGAGEVLVSSTVRDLLLNSEWSFTSAGFHVLKGVPGTWELFRLDDGRHRPRIPSRDAESTRSDRMALRLARTAPKLTRLGVSMGNAVQRRRTKSPTIESGR
jgi:class 3 adenylate cyclase/pimeloyl-ACP methyl ester carboxylesterase